MRWLAIATSAVVSSALLVTLTIAAQKETKKTVVWPPVKALPAPRAGLPAINPNALLTFMILFGGMGKDTPSLGDGSDMPTAWRNDLRKPFTVYNVVCKTASGQAEILPTLEPGGLTSMLTNVCPCRPTSWTMCAVNGLPVINSYADDGATCPTPPCEFGILVPKGGGAQGLRVSITGPVAP